MGGEGAGDARDPPGEGQEDDGDDDEAEGAAHLGLTQFDDGGAGGEQAAGLGEPAGHGGLRAWAEVLGEGGVGAGEVAGVELRAGLGGDGGGGGADDDAVAVGNGDEAFEAGGDAGPEAVLGGFFGAGGVGFLGGVGVGFDELRHGGGWGGREGGEGGRGVGDGAEGLARIEGHAGAGELVQGFDFGGEFGEVRAVGGQGGEGCVVGGDLRLQGRDFGGEDGGFFAEIGLDGDAVGGGLDFGGGLLEGGDLVLQGADLHLLVGDGGLGGGRGFGGGLVEMPEIDFAGGEDKESDYAEDGPEAALFGGCGCGFLRAWRWWWLGCLGCWRFRRGWWNDDRGWRGDWLRVGNGIFGHFRSANKSASVGANATRISLQGNPCSGVATAWLKAKAVIVSVSGGPKRVKARAVSAE